jgi:hypothetical protein
MNHWQPDFSAASTIRANERLPSPSSQNSGWLFVRSRAFFPQIREGHNDRFSISQLTSHIILQERIKPLITRINTDMKNWARVHSLREWGRVKQILCKQACRIFAFFLPIPANWDHPCPEIRGWFFSNCARSWVA